MSVHGVTLSVVPRRVSAPQGPVVRWPPRSLSAPLGPHLRASPLLLPPPPPPPPLPPCRVSCFCWHLTLKVLLPVISCFLAAVDYPPATPHDFLLCITFVNIIIFLCQCIKVYTVHLFFCSVNVLYEMTECVAGVFM